MMLPVGAGGVPQFNPVSPILAAGLLLISTVALPLIILLLFCGGAWKVVPGGVGVCDGLFVAVLVSIAAGLPVILTLLLKPPSNLPLNGCGKGVGIGGAGGAGTITI